MPTLICNSNHFEKTGALLLKQMRHLMMTILEERGTSLYGGLPTY